MNVEQMMLQWHVITGFKVSYQNKHPIKYLQKDEADIETMTKELDVRIRT